MSSDFTLPNSDFISEGGSRRGSATNNRKNVCEVLDAEQLFESPIDINISKVIPVNIAPELSWLNYELPPKKMKITNTGHTVIMSGKWGQERPYITNGVLAGKYVFSQLHFHWGVNDMEGSEHTIDGRQYPGEIHVVLFKSCYLTQESALKEKDGIAILVYIINLRDPPNLDFQFIVDALPSIAKAHTSAKIPPMQLNFLMSPFESDYFMYRGSVSTSNCIHPIIWLITRIPITVSSDQMDSFRFLLDNDDEIIRRNFRPLQEINGRHVFHILPSTSKYSTLLPAPAMNVGDKITHIYRIQIHNGTEIKLIEEVDDEEHENTKSNEVECLFEKHLYTEEELLSKTMSVISELSKYIDLIY